LEGTCKIVYDDRDENVVYEVVNLRKVEWKSCTNRARKFVSLQDDPSQDQMEEILKLALKGYAESVTLKILEG